MEYPLARRHPPTPSPLSPCLFRSRSGAENNSTSTNTSQRFTSRSKSTTRSRNIPNEENIIPSSTGHKKDTNHDNCSRDGFVRFLQRGSPTPRDSPATNRPKSASRSPSAWALSPGRSLFNMFPPELPAATGGEREGKPKVDVGQLLQWRFANSRAEAVMASVRIAAEDRLFHVWLRIFNARNIILEKRMEILKMKHQMKLCQIINPQMSLLNEWAKMERKNCEAVGRLTRKLSALSVKLPLAEEVKGDVESIYRAMSTAVEVMDSIEATITKFISQVEKILYLLTELTSTLEHQKESLGDMEKIVTMVAELLNQVEDGSATTQIRQAMQPWVPSAGCRLLRDVKWALEV
ncbi:hypothetical protein GH714_040364 [Hevea brasiliensis]|uniref:QWRF motif-containing protein n=1 Tax=Hevea brasiliensis TaxID=3981 RepID=A0A6A6MPN9_HEVBR|nr:hypothetical protein GH714_040364 [Hevea brasiliensis]